ncbi:methylated-DNA--[protein]-cysteine S-methyltransferase [bacterium]|nr:MAG: methylated-DNA--[protein]-cysteine S-methyltransferase [bacterium]
MNILHENHAVIIDTPIGLVRVSARGDKIVALEFVEKGKAGTPPEGVLAEAARQLREYFSLKRKSFEMDLDFSLASTPFRERVWETVSMIPYGETLTYGDIARELETSPRAVGGAMRANPIPIILPCHRVVGGSGTGGYSGEWERGKALSVKEKLLGMENPKRK